MTIRRALDLSQAATVRTPDGRLLRMRLVIGWDCPTTNWLDEAAASGDGSVIEFALIGAGVLRDTVRALRYRLQKRRDWWLVKQLDNEEPLARLHRDRASATQEAERELLAAVAGGGRYLPYGEQPATCRAGWARRGPREPPEGVRHDASCTRRPVAAGRSDAAGRR